MAVTWLENQPDFMYRHTPEDWEMTNEIQEACKILDKMTAFCNSQDKKDRITTDEHSYLLTVKQKLTDKYSGRFGSLSAAEIEELDQQYLRLLGEIGFKHPKKRSQNEIGNRIINMFWGRKKN